MENSTRAVHGHRMKINESDPYKEVLASLPDPYKLDEEWTLRAKEEVNEDPSTVRDNVQALRNLVQEEEELDSRTDDFFLLAFLRARKHNIEEAFKLLKNFYYMKKKYPKYFELCLPSENKGVYDLNIATLLEEKDQCGRAVMICSTDFNGYKVTCEQMVQFVTMILELSILDPRVQISGLVIVADVGKQNMSHNRFMSPTMLYLIAKLWQNSFPIRMKMINITNEGFLFHALFTILRTFLKKKLRDRFHLHGKQFSSLHKMVTPEILPERWGGTKGPMQSDTFQQRLTSYEPIFREWVKYGYRDTTS